MQDQYNHSVDQEMHVNMNAGSQAFIGNAARMNHKQVVGNKAVHNTARTEVQNHEGPKPDVTKNFSRLPKAHWVPQPNNYGEPVAHRVLKKAGAGGVQKGGIKY